MTPRPDVVVVGGGVSGLAAAVALAKAGARVTVLEARGVLGGRATSFRDARTHEVFDNGQHALMGCYHETFAFLESIGARDAVAVQDRLCLPMVDRSGRPLTLDCPEWPAPWHLLAGVLAWREMPLPERLRVLRLAPALARARRAALGHGDLPCAPGERVSEWLARHGQGPRLIEALWEPLALAALNQHVDAAAAPTFVRVLGRVFAGDRHNASLALATRPLVDTFGEPARRTLETLGSTVRLHALAKVVVAGGRVRAVEIRGEAIAAATVVVATPWFTWPQMLTGDTAAIAPVIAAARGTAASPIVTVTLGFDRPVLREPVVGFPGQAMQWAFDTSALGSAPVGSRVALVSSGAEDVLRQPELDVIAVARRVIDTLGAAAREARLVSARVVREPRATFSLAPGQPARPGTRTGVRGLYLAGDWVDTGLPATIEGAVEAGHRAAAAVLEDAR